MKYPLSPLILLAALLACSNISSPIPQLPVDDHFIIRMNQDSTDYCWSWIIPDTIPDEFCSETLHTADTAGATYFSSDTNDRLAITPGGHRYQRPSYPSSVACDQNICTTWINDIKTDQMKYWGNFGYVCSLAGHAVAIIRSVRTAAYLIGTPGDTVTVTYRDSISTPAGTTRNNLFSIFHPGDTIQAFEISIKTMSSGFSITHPGTTFPIMSYNGTMFPVHFQISASNTVSPGSYKIEFNITIDGKDYGNVPCTIIITN